MSGLSESMCGTVGRVLTLRTPQPAWPCPQTSRCLASWWVFPLVQRSQPLWRLFSPFRGGGEIRLGAPSACGSTSTAWEAGSLAGAGCICHQPCRQQRAGSEPASSHICKLFNFCFLRKSRLISRNKGGETQSVPLDS